MAVRIPFGRGVGIPGQAADDQVMDGDVVTFGDSKGHVDAPPDRNQRLHVAARTRPENRNFTTTPGSECPTRYGMLAQYIQDVRIHLSQHRLRFYVQADLVQSSEKVPDDPVIDVDTSNGASRSCSRMASCA